MPPKRKRGDDTEMETAAPNTRATRASTRKAATSSTASPPKNEPGSSKKKESKTKARAPAKMPTKAETMVAEASQPQKPAAKRAEKQETANNVPASDQPQTSPIKKTSSMESKKSSPVKEASYQKQRMEQLFTEYADKDDRSYIGSEGLEGLCVAAKIPMDGPQTLILAWLLDAKEFGKLTKEEWCCALNPMKIDTLEKLAVALKEYEDLVINDKKPISSNSKGFSTTPYNRSHTYAQYASNPTRAFDKLYSFVFALAKPEQARNIDIDIAKAFWEIILTPKFPLVNEFLEFLKTQEKLKGVNKDLWGMTLEFFKTVEPDLQNYEDADGAWPTTLDDFVAWKNQPKQNA